MVGWFGRKKVMYISCRAFFQKQSLPLSSRQNYCSTSRLFPRTKGVEHRSNNQSYLNGHKARGLMGKFVVRTVRHSYQVCASLQPSCRGGQTSPAVAGNYRRAGEVIGRFVILSATCPLAFSWSFQFLARDYRALRLMGLAGWAPELRDMRREVRGLWTMRPHGQANSFSLLMYCNE